MEKGIWREMKRRAEQRRDEKRRGCDSIEEKNRRDMCGMVHVLMTLIGYEAI